MEYVYASLLLHYAKRPIAEEGLRKVLEAAGIEVDEVRVKAVVAALSGVNIDEAIKSAALAMPVAATVQPAQPAAAPAAQVTEAAPKEEKKEEKTEEEAVEGLAALFG